MGYNNTLFSTMSFAIDCYLYAILITIFLKAVNCDPRNAVFEVLQKITSIKIKILPQILRVDTQLIVIAILLQLINSMAYSRFHIGLGNLFFSIGALGLKIANIYFFSIIIQAIASWIPNLRQNAITQIVYSIAIPLFIMIQKIIPPIKHIDFSPLILLFLIKVISDIVFMGFIELSYAMFAH